MFPQVSIFAQKSRSAQISDKSGIWISDIHCNPWRKDFKIECFYKKCLNTFYFSFSLSFPLFSRIFCYFNWLHRNRAISIFLEFTVPGFRPECAELEPPKSSRLKDSPHLEIFCGLRLILSLLCLMSLERYIKRKT